jgi:phenylacetate-CoA ligase
MMQVYDDQEFLSFDERKRLIDLRLSEMVTVGYQKSSRIKRICDELNLSSSNIKTVNDFECFPVLSRSKLIELESLEPPFGGFQNNDEGIDRIFTSPGPVYEPHLSEDDPLWARAYVAAGIRKGDVVLNTFSYHMVAAGLTFHGGLRRIGATVIPSGTSSSQIQVQLIRDLGVTAFTGTPSFFMSIIKKAEEMGYDFKKDFRLRCACFAAEPLEPALREIFERRYAVDTYQMYGATEVGDIAFECNEKKGWHICEEVFVEIVDPITGKRVLPGNFGEVVVTRFNNIFFLFRFGTGDLSRLIESPCPCGRTSYRLDGIMGRIGDAVKVRGLFITPNQLKKITEKFQNMKFQALINRSAHEDILTLKVEPTQSQGDCHSLEMKISDSFKDLCTVKIDELLFVEQGTIKEDDPLIVDLRKWT